MLERLREQFEVPGVVAFDEGEGGLTRIRVTSPLGEAHIYLLGAHVTHWQPAGQAPVLWLSRRSSFAVGKPIRGGVPVCHPWFANRQGEPDAPLHGFVRLMEWDVESVAKRDDGSVGLVLWSKYGLGMANWPGHFEVRHHVSVGRTLRLALETRNCGPQPLTITEALHSYFRVSDVRKVTLTGLAGCEHFDKVAGGANRRQGDEPIALAGEMDNVYLHTEAECLLDDPGLGRRIRVAKRGSRSTILWNPWIEKARRMADFGDDEWPQMLCIETANALADAVTIAPGQSHTMEAHISVEPLTAKGAPPRPSAQAADLPKFAVTGGPRDRATGGDASRLTAAIHVRAAPARVFEAWATAAGLAGWLLAEAEFRPAGAGAARADGAARAGDALGWTWADGRATQGTVAAACWPDRLAFALGPAGHCEVLLCPEADGTRVEVAQTDLPDAAARLRCAARWAFHLTNLKSVLESGHDLRETDPSRPDVVNR